MENVPLLANTTCFLLPNPSFLFQMRLRSQRSKLHSLPLAVAQLCVFNLSLIGAKLTWKLPLQIWKIWPAVLFYTIFSTGKFYALDHKSRFLIHISCPVIVVLEEKAKIRSLAIPNVLLTVLGVSPSRTSWRTFSRYMIGVVIGFVISYRAMSGWSHSFLWTKSCNWCIHRVWSVLARKKVRIL